MARQPKAPAGRTLENVQNDFMVVTQRAGDLAYTIRRQQAQLNLLYDTLDRLAEEHAKLMAQQTLVQAKKAGETKK